MAVRSPVAITPEVTYTEPDVAGRGLSARVKCSSTAVDESPLKYVSTAQLELKYLVCIGGGEGAAGEWLASSSSLSTFVTVAMAVAVAVAVAVIDGLLHR